MNHEGNPPNAAIVGRPNVGKSALFNRLAGRKIAIVHGEPGITRDRISATCNRGSRPFVIWDTGGIGAAGEWELTKQVQETAEQAVRQSELLLLVVDAKQGLSPMDAELGRMLRKSRKPIVLVINKVDDPKHEALADDFAELGFERSVAISAAHGRGIPELIEAIDELLPTLAEIKHQTSNVKHARPLPIAVIGRPNAGKSSFINAIIQSERAIVSELPGTTRDAVDIVYQHGARQFTFIDTAGIRRRSRHSSSAEVFSVMRAEQSIRRARLCVLIADVTNGVTAQDKRIAGLMQRASKPAIVVLNKWDLIKPKQREKKAISELVAETRQRLFFLDYAPVVIASARTGENVDQLFRAIEKVRRAATNRLGTGVLNRLLRAAFAANPPPMVSGRRLKLFYAAQAGGKPDADLQPPEFVLFVNDPRLLNETYRKYLEARIREAEPYVGLPIVLTCRSRKRQG